MNKLNEIMIPHVLEWLKQGDISVDVACVLLLDYQSFPKVITHYDQDDETVSFSNN
jgi:hypothetical protein